MHFLLLIGNGQVLHNYWKGGFAKIDHGCYERYGEGKWLR
jgi:hypothetical protein